MWPLEKLLSTLSCKSSVNVSKHCKLSLGETAQKNTDCKLNYSAGSHQRPRELAPTSLYMEGLPFATISTGSLLWLAHAPTAVSWIVNKTITCRIFPASDATCIQIL